ncbi:uncharacterized protein [Lolium perenne]|uniref:uncharacterized protein n=1 Tax=Lolium perenne TaxID=4522 RepID=UPI0021EA6291|nr:uncharacterized protein LOC127292544 [Lolium perenne]
MSSAAVKPELPLLPVAPLDGESGYLRWKESVLLRLHTLGLARALSEEYEPERPTVEKQRARERDDALCRGHILAMLSDRLLPLYAHHATAGAVWRAVGLTYDLDAGMDVFRYDEGTPLLENLARLQATLAAAGKLSQILMRCSIEFGGFPSEMAREVDKVPNVSMAGIWKIARRQVVSDRVGEVQRHARYTTDGQGSSSSDDSRPLKRVRQG